MSTIQRELFIFAEQKIGSSEAIPDPISGVVKKAPTSAFRAFTIDAVEQSQCVRWNSKKLNALLGNSTQGSFGFGLCILSGLDEQLVF